MDPFKVGDRVTKAPEKYWDGRPNEAYPGRVGVIKSVKVAPAAPGHKAWFYRVRWEGARNLETELSYGTPELKLVLDSKPALG